MDQTRLTGFTTLPSAGPGRWARDERRNLSLSLGESSGPLGQRVTGFTVLEVLLVVAVGVVLATLVVPLAATLPGGSQLTASTAEVIQTVRTAREQSVAGLNDAPHGVFFQVTAGDDAVVLYEGTSYPARTGERVVALPSSLSLSTTLPSADVTFSSGFGLPSATGSVTLTHAVTGTRSFTVNSLGLVSEN